MRQPEVAVTRAEPTQPTTGAWDRRTVVRRWLRQRRLLTAFLAAAAGLAAGAAATPPLASSVLRTAIAALAVAALVTGVRLQRPTAAAGWWLMAGGAAAGGLATLASTVSIAATGDTRPEEWAYALLVAGQYPLLIAGLIVLGRLSGRTRTTDLLDAFTIALATFLLLFALVIRPVLPEGTFALVIAVSFPLGALLLLALVVRMILSTGVPTASVGLLLAAMCARVAATVSMLIPALTTGALQISPVTRPLSVLAYTLLGAAALHPSLRHTRAQEPAEDGPVSRRRMALLAIFAVVAPVALIAEVREATRIDPPGMMVPLFAAAGLLLLLVGRLGLTADLAQRRAAELARRSTDLAEAVQEQQALQQQLRYQAMHDPLTGLPNRIVLTERLEWALGRRLESSRHALALLDLDHFKDVNDTLGHTAGDELLVEVSHRLLALAPAGGMVARLGGDEFAVLMEETSAADAEARTAQIQQTIRQPYRIGGQELQLSTSVGLLTVEPGTPPASATAVLRDADVALYAAKSTGRNRVARFRPELRTAQLNLTRLSAALRRATANQELTVHYQPVVDLTSGQVTAVEALLRWYPPDRPPVAPAEFIPVAEETGLIGAIGAWVLRQACWQARPWFERHGVAVAVNVSPRQLAEDGFAELVLATLRETGMPGHGLILEVTESSLAATSGADETMRGLERLRRHGVRVAIDDFGTGYSSLAYVARLPVDIVKLDRSFIQPARGGGGGHGWAFIRAVLNLVESLQLEAVAEGVETLEQAELLRELRCRLVQGYLFGRPIPGELVEQSLGSAPAPAGGGPRRSPPPA